jgi:GH15 family glucan-1,4-alpha-glucosidase
VIETLTHAKPIASAATGYLPIEEHGVIGDLRSVALVGTDGTIDWYCPVRFDAPSVFAARLDKERGGYVQHYDTDVLDASLLLMPLVKFISPTDRAGSRPST